MVASRSTSAQTGSQLDAWDERGRRRPDVTLGRLNDSLFIANRHLVAIAQEQVRLASAEKQPLAVRLHALSALQKTLSTGIPLAARRAVVPPRWPQSER